MATDKTPAPATPAGATAPATKGKAKRAKRVPSALETSIVAEQKIARRIVRQLDSLSEEARGRVIATIAQYTGNGAD